MSEATTGFAWGRGAAALGEPTSVQDIESWAGEVRLNLVRLAALIVFYAYHLVNVFLSRDDPGLAGTYHVAVTALVMVWSIGVMALYLCLSRRWLPSALKYVVTIWDMVLVTTLLILAGGPRTPLLILLFLVIGAAPLRLSLPVVWLATLGSMAGYAFVLGYYAYYLVGYDRYYTHPELQIPRTQEVIFVLGLGAAGLLAGQVVRQTTRLIQGCQGVPHEPGLSPPVPARDAVADVRWDAKWIAAGLFAIAVLVGFGILFSFIAGPAWERHVTGWVASLVIGVVFVVSVAASFVEVWRPENRAGGGIAPAPQARGPGGTASNPEGRPWT